MSVPFTGCNFCLLVSKNTDTLLHVSIRIRIFKNLTTTVSVCVHKMFCKHVPFPSVKYSTDTNVMAASSYLKPRYASTPSRHSFFLGLHSDVDDWIFLKKKQTNTCIYTLYNPMQQTWYKSSNVSMTKNESFYKNGR